MAKPWICPECGEPNNGDNCGKCGASCPVDFGIINAPGSYFNIMYGPKGCIGVFLIWLIPLLFLVMRQLLVQTGT